MYTWTDSKEDKHSVGIPCYNSTFFVLRTYKWLILANLLPCDRTHYPYWLTLLLPYLLKVLTTYLLLPCDYTRYPYCARPIWTWRGRNQPWQSETTCWRQLSRSAWLWTERSTKTTRQPSATTRTGWISCWTAYSVRRIEYMLAEAFQKPFLHPNQCVSQGHVIHTEIKLGKNV